MNMLKFHKLKIWQDDDKKQSKDNQPPSSRRVINNYTPAAGLMMLIITLLHVVISWPPVSYIVKLCWNRPSVPYQTKRIRHMHIEGFDQHEAVLFDQCFLAADLFASTLRGVACWPTYMSWCVVTRYWPTLKCLSISRNYTIFFVIEVYPWPT